MKNPCSSKNLLTLLPLALAIAITAGCAVKQEAAVEPAPTPEPDAALLLAYSMPNDRALRYKTTMEQTHEMGRMGQILQSALYRDNECTITAGGPETADLDLEVTIDSYTFKVEAPRGTIGREISEIEGRSFFMALSPSGIESGFKMTPAVAFEMQPAGKMNASHDFEGFFPDLPDKPVSLGGSWKSTDRVTDRAFNSGKKIILETVYKLVGFEIVEGMECARISGMISGRLDESGESMIRAPEMTAQFNGRGDWLFAHDEGMMVKSDVTLDGAGEMVTGGGQGPPARMRQHMTIATQLLQ